MISTELTKELFDSNANSTALDKYYCLFILGFIAVAALLFLLSLRNRNKTGNEKISLIKLGFAALFLSVFYCLTVLRYGFCTKSLTGFLFVSILAYAGLSDLLTKTADNYLSVMLVLTGFIGVSVRAVLIRLACGIVTLLFFVFISMAIKRGGLGGADIKIAASSAVVLGLYKCLISLVIALPAAVVTMLVLHKAGKYELKKPFALLPFIAIGASIAFVI